MKLSLLKQKSDQSIPQGHLGHEACDLVTPNEQRVTQSGVIFASTQRDEAIFSPNFVTPSSGTEVNRLFNELNSAHSAALVKKMTLGSDSFIRDNRP